MTNNSQIAGILSIVSGVLGLLGAACLLIMVFFMNAMFGMAFEMDPTVPYEMNNFFNFFGLMYGGMGGFLALISILAIVGGAYSIKKKYWGLGLAGAIAGTVTFFPCGIAAIILVCLGKQEFDRPSQASLAIQYPPPAQ